MWENNIDSRYHNVIKVRLIFPLLLPISLSTQQSHTDFVVRHSLFQSFSHRKEHRLGRVSPSSSASWSVAAFSATPWADRKLNKDTEAGIVGHIGGDAVRRRHQSHWWGDGGSSDGSATVELKGQEGQRVCISYGSQRWLANPQRIG